MAQVQTGAAWNLWRIGIPAGSSNPDLWDVDCRTATSCLAVGQKTVSGDPKPLGMDWNGTAWVDNGARVQTNASLRGVSCVTAGFCMAVGQTGTEATAQVWSGFGWTVLPTPPKPATNRDAVLNSVSCVSTTWCLAVGSTTTRDGFVEQRADVWNGTRWTAATPPLAGSFFISNYGVSCRSTTECWTVGDAYIFTSGGGGKWVPIGAKWTGSWSSSIGLPYAVSADGARLRDISCIGTDSCIATGWSLFGGTPTGLVETLTP
jgi:hypothetical protein